MARMEFSGPTTGMADSTWYSFGRIVNPILTTTTPDHAAALAHNVAGYAKPFATVVTHACIEIAAAQTQPDRP